MHIKKNHFKATKRSNLEGRVITEFWAVNTGKFLLKKTSSESNIQQRYGSPSEPVYRDH